MQPVALVSGGNKGIGLATCRQLHALGYRVFLGSRDAARGAVAAASIDPGLERIESLELDVSSEDSIRRAVARVSAQAGRLDALINNAGVYSTEGMEFESQVIRESFVINALGPLLLSRESVPLLRQCPGSRIVNVSTGMAQTSDRREGSIAYRISKTALNAITRIVSNELYDDRIWVNAVCPGWVRTDIGGANANRTPEQGADTVVWLASGGAGEATGKFYRDRKEIPW